MERAHAKEREAYPNLVVAKKTKIPASVEATVTRDAKPKAKAKATAKNKGKPRSRKTASRNASSSGSAPSGTMTARANHAAGANHAAANDDNGEVDGAPETPPTGPTADEIRKAENKKRLSRKSSAYHKAALKAKKQGRNCRCGEGCFLDYICFCTLQTDEYGNQYAKNIF